MMGASEIERLHAVASLDDRIATRFKQIVEELHVELVVFDDHHGLRHAASLGTNALPGPVFCRNAQVTSNCFPNNECGDDAIIGQAAARRRRTGRSLPRSACRGSWA